MQLATSLSMRTLPQLKPYTPRYALLRLLLRLSAPLSNGIAMGATYGFDSGPMLDYVYCNQPRGRTKLGRWLDQIYLNQLGWRASRTRKAHLQRQIQLLLQERRARGEPTHILDLGAGPSRYLLEVLADYRHQAVTVTCVDTDLHALTQGQQLAAALGVAEQVQFMRGDATNTTDLAQIQTRPDIVVVSGLYELMTDDAAVCRSLLSIRSLLPLGGTLLFTMQVEHPQLELIANVLTKRDGAPWLMGTRPLSRVERWGREAGFHTVRSELEPHGVFSVTRCGA